MSRIVKKIVAVFLVAAVLVACASCFEKAVSVFSMSLKSADKHIGSGNTDFHTLTVLPENTVTTSGFVALSFEPSSATVCVTELTEGNVWSVLPLFSNGAASAFDIVLRTADGVYCLNSQDNSVAYGSYEYKLRDNGVTVEYFVADRAENATGRVSAVSNGVAVKLSVDYILSGGDLRVSIDCSKIELSDGAVLESLALLPYFGAIKKNGDVENTALAQAVLSSAKELAGIDEKAQTTESDTKSNASDVEETETASDGSEKNKDESESNDFILVPDGSGAVMLTGKEDEATSELTFDVYGRDENRARIPVFGIKNGNGAFAAIIGDGAANAEIKARRAEKDAFDAATVYPVFTVTDSSEDGGKFIYADSYKGMLSVCYRFMSGSEANYISMASACREELIRNGTLSSKTLDSNDYPLNIAVTASVDGSSKQTVSTFEEVEDMLQLLKAKGVENVTLVLNGIFSGGLVRTDGEALRVLRSAGGTSGLQRLYDYAAKQKFGVFAGVTLVKADGISGGNAAKGLNGKALSSSVKNSLAPYVGQASYSVELISADKIEKSTVTLMTDAEKLPISGLCLLDGDIGSYADYGSWASSTAVSELLSKNISAFSTRKKLALADACFNTIKNASLVTELPLCSANKENDAYVSVPLIPAVLHSTVIYSGTPVNSGSAAQLELLKCVEYGAQPYYHWVFDSGSHYYYEQTFNDAVSFVVKAAQELGDLGMCRITSHSEIEDNVFCTGYDNGALVYVNYNNYSVNIGDISVLPYDYIRIN